MAKKVKTIPVGRPSVKYIAKSKKKRARETKEDFYHRVLKQFPEIIVGVNGNFESASLVFGLKLDVFTAMIKTSRVCQEAYTRAKAIAAAEKHEGVAVAKKMKDNMLGLADPKDKRLKRKSWPRDLDDREDSIRDALMISLLENEGNVVETGLCLSVELPEILDLMEKYPELMEQKDRGMKLGVFQAEASLAKQVKAGNVSAVKTYLTNKSPDEWTEKSSVTVSHTGFAPPDEKETSVPLLELIKGKSDEE